MEDPKKEKESPELKEELTEDELKGVDGGGEFPGHLPINNQPEPHTSSGPDKTPPLLSEVRNWSESTLNHRNAFAMVPVTL